ncbi:MAG: hypothetical protein KatS3mg076_1507 [Candidatus Binatia bacterium]|nr:MAG: hypothetical protein KatS3mg076_1507 [Candidatus Binatia bacterium]
MTEVELKLVLVGPEAGPLRASLARLRRAGRLLLFPRGRKVLRDLYFDFPDRKLARRGMGVRIRHATGRVFLGWKAGESSRGRAILEREEFEIPWSPSALGKFRESLARRGVRLGPPGGAAAGPRAALLALGLVVVQERRTERVVREVFLGTTRVAEFDLDEVEYRLRSGSVVHREIEVEKKAEPDVLGEFRAWLLARYGNALRPWPYSKLATGFALERLEGKGVRLRGPLPPRAYELLRRELRRPAF